MTKLFQIVSATGYPLGTVHAVSIDEAAGSFRRMVDSPPCFEPLRAVDPSSPEAERAHQKAARAMDRA